MMARQLGCGQVPPRLFLHEFPKPREEIKESLQAKRVFEYQCSPTIYSWSPVPTTMAHPFFITWWQELHDHIFSEPVHSFCLELMPDFQPASEVTYLSFFFCQACPPLLIMIFATSCKIQYPPLEPGQLLRIQQAQSLLWDLNPQLWFS
jgi:hypothetical protein